MDLGIDVRIEAIKAEETKVAQDFFGGKLSVEEECHRLTMLWVERLKLQGIQEYARMNGVDPAKVSVTTSVDGVTNMPVYSIKP